MDMEWLSGTILNELMRMMMLSKKAHLVLVPAEFHSLLVLSVEKKSNGERKRIFWNGWWWIEREEKYRNSIRKIKAILEHLATRKNRATFWLSKFEKHSINWHAYKLCQKKGIISYIFKGSFEMDHFHSTPLFPTSTFQRKVRNSKKI